MRAIKFRGMHRSGGWYYGEMSEPWDNGKPDVLPLRLFFMMVENDRIDKGTVGQFTGLHDKNGKEIYEGDIVRYDDYQGIAEIGFKKIEFSEKVEFKGGCFYPVCNQPPYTFEVIGNVYENPELLK